MADLFFGKYRGIVTNISDPENCGRIKARVPSITGNYETGWCLPCFPSSGNLIYPHVGDNVWIEFERGKVDYPIWCGVWFPKTAMIPKDVISANGGTISMTNGEVSLSNVNGQSINVGQIKSEFENIKDWCIRTFKKIGE